MEYGTTIEPIPVSGRFVEVGPRYILAGDDGSVWRLVFYMNGARWVKTTEAAPIPKDERGQ